MRPSFFTKVVLVFAVMPTVFGAAYMSFTTLYGVLVSSFIGTPPAALGTGILIAAAAFAVALTWMVMVNAWPRSPESIDPRDRSPSPR